MEEQEAKVVGNPIIDNAPSDEVRTLRETVARGTI
jgi:hypothetical protein